MHPQPKICQKFGKKRETIEKKRKKRENREKEEKSGKKAKIGKVLSRCSSLQIGLATPLSLVLSFMTLLS